MKKLHIHIGVESLDQSIRFYSALFGATPVKTKTDYAKWMLDVMRRVSLKNYAATLNRPKWPCTQKAKRFAAMPVLINYGSRVHQTFHGKPIKASSMLIYLMLLKKPVHRLVSPRPKIVN